MGRPGRRDLTMATVRVNGVELYYEVHGEGAPVLLIHGLGSSTRDWEPQVPALAAAYKVIAFDVRGHGRSEKPRQRYSVKLFADDTAALIRALGIAPIHVVGISMGGMIAFQLAADAPELVRSLAIVNSGPAMPIKTFAQRLMIWSRVAIVRVRGMRKMGEVLATRLLPEPEHAAARAQFIERWADNDPRAYLAALHGAPLSFAPGGRTPSRVGRMAQSSIEIPFEDGVISASSWKDRHRPGVLRSREEWSPPASSAKSTVCAT